DEETGWHTSLSNVGVSHCDAFRLHLTEALETEVKTHPDAQFAGALGAALVGGRQKKRGLHGG
ncbi:hypothetical protein ACBQ19_07295, partial [Hafnia alvei]